MALETVTYIDELNPANPLPNDPTSQGDDHIRNIKKALKATFPNIAAAVTKTAAQINRLVETTRKYSAGDGLTGGGDMTEDRVFSVDSSVARRTQMINTNAGSGLLGGGAFSGNLNLSVDPNQVAMNPSTVVRTSRTINTGSGLSGGGDLSGNLTLTVDGTVVRDTRTITAGDGLTGGGSLADNRTLSMGTPSSITADSTNSASGDTHTHAISAATIGELASRLSVGEVGTYALLADINTTINLNPGAIRAGSNLRYASAGGHTFGTAPAGTWQLCGFTPGGSSTHQQRATVWMRVS